MSAITAKASRKMKKYAVLTREPRCFLGSFDFSWEQRKAIDIADYSKGNGYSKGDLTDAGTPIILYGRLYTKYQFAISEVDTFAFPRNGAVYSQGNEVIVPASGETAEDIARASAVEKSGVLLGGDLNILRPFDFINPLFLALAISNGEPQKELAKKAQGKSVVHIHNTDIQEVTIAYPSRTEQDRIVSVFRQLDNLITLHQRKCANLCSPSQVVFSLLFVTSTFSWEQRKLGELVDRVVRKNTNNESTLPLTISAQYGLVDQITYFNNRVASRDVSNYYLVLNGEFAYNKSTSDGYPFGAVKRLDLYEKGVLSTLYIVFAPKKEQQIDSDYLTVFFDTDRWHKGVAERAAEGARNHGLLNISAEDFFDIDLSVPKDIVEQKQIGAFIRQLDNLITLHQRECISFTGRADRLILTANKKRTTSSWEQRKVSDLAEKTYGGGTPTTSNEAYWNGDIPWIQSSDVVDGKLLGVEPRKWITQDGLNNSAAQLIPGNSIAIITRVGVGKLAFMPYSYATSQDFLSLSKLNAEPLFTVYACYKKLQSELNAVQGTSIKGITKDELLAKNIMVPRYAEQQQIGAFFKQLDNLITLHQRKPFLMKWRTSDANRNQTNRLVL